MESYISVHGIQKEQKKIIEIEKELKLLLTKINQSINCLQVEELQLKSLNVFSSYKSQKCKSFTHQSEKDENKSTTHLAKLKCSPTNFEHYENADSYDEYKMFDDPTLINKQLLNLDIAIAPK